MDSQLDNRKRLGRVQLNNLTIKNSLFNINLKHKKMKDLICKAIASRLVIEFIYENEIRIVEPFVLGYHKDTGNLILRSFRVGGYSKSEREPYWRLFDISKIKDLKITQKKAMDFREFYNPNDKHMDKILCNV